MAGRYATALFELALEGNALDAVAADLRQFDALVAESADRRRLGRSPEFRADKQYKELPDLLDRPGIKGIASEFLKVEAAYRR